MQGVCKYGSMHERKYTEFRKEFQQFFIKAPNEGHTEGI